MQPLNLVTKPDFTKPVPNLGVSQIRYTERGGQLSSVVLFGPEGTDKEQVFTIARAAKAAWTGLLISIVEQKPADPLKVWATDQREKLGRIGGSMAEHHGGEPEAVKGL